MTMYPTIPLKGGPFSGQRRPIINRHIPALIERLPEKGGMIEVYAHERGDDGNDAFVYQGKRKIGHKEIHRG